MCQTTNIYGLDKSLGSKFEISVKPYQKKNNMCINGSETTSSGATLTAEAADQIDRAVKEEVIGPMPHDAILCLKGMGAIMRLS